MKLDNVFAYYFIFFFILKNSNYTQNEQNEMYFLGPQQENYCFLKNPFILQFFFTLLKLFFSHLFSPFLCSFSVYIFFHTFFHTFFIHTQFIFFTYFFHNFFHTFFIHTVLLFTYFFRTFFTPFLFTQFFFLIFFTLFSHLF